MPTLMIQGTTSDAGKSTLVAGLGRCLRRRGLSVAPFKPQNMALNSAVTPEGGEIGRAQALQAQACGLAPHADMNPILLKPTTDIGAQVIVHGKAIGTMQAGAYHDYKRIAMEAVLRSHGRLRARYEHVLVEGAGSPAEINLRDRDIANMGFAEAVDCPVILIADIDRGGVFAHLVGTLALLCGSEQARVKGFVINRFRGDFELLRPGIEWLEDYTGKPVLGTLPYLHGLALDAEDAMPRESEAKPDAAIRVRVPALPRISNHNDFDPLRLHPQVDFQFVGPDAAYDGADLIILPGSKAVRQDLEWLREQGWQERLEQHLRYGGKVLGICGGMQMLGKTITDALGMEGEAGNSDGMGFLDVHTELKGDKVLVNRRGRVCFPNQEDAIAEGYEIHLGRTTGPDTARPLLHYGAGQDGAISSDTRIAGTYWHGLFEQAESLQACLAWAGLSSASAFDHNERREQELNRLADAIETSMDVNKVMALLQANEPASSERQRR